MIKEQELVAILPDGSIEPANLKTHAGLPIGVIDKNGNFNQNFKLEK